MPHWLSENMNPAFFTVLSAAAFLAFSSSSTAQHYEYYAPHRMAVIMEASMETALKAGKVGRINLSDRNAVEAFYQARDFKPYWIEDGALNWKADYLIKTLEESWTHGLNPYNYHIDTIRDIGRELHFLDRAKLELILSDAYLRYARDLSGMRVAPRAMKLRREDWVQPRGGHEVMQILMNGRRFSRNLNELAPSGRTYKALQAELVRLVEDDEEAYAYEQYLPIDPGGMLKPGWGHKSVVKIRARLGLENPERNKYRYDDRLAAAVMKFQRENKLNADGIIGISTLKALNKTKKSKIYQIIANLERLRWVNPDMGKRYVVVNIPSATLWAVENGRVEFEMPVIVGTPWRRTRSFVTEITGMRFSPTWTIPPTIKKYDILPEIKADINFLYDRNIELYKGYGRERVSLDPQTIDWQNITRRELSQIQMVQLPGENNPLGRYRVLMPNPFNVYLHDTNHPELFDSSERTLSSGCMRMKYPEKMARFVLKGQPGRDHSEIHKHLEKAEETEIYIKDKIPAYIFYYTAWLDENGKVIYGQDVYDYDKKLIEQLVNIDGFHIPGHNGAYSLADAGQF